MVDEAHRDQRLRRGKLRRIAKFGIAFAVRRRHRNAAAFHAGEEQRRRALHLEPAPGAIRTARTVAHEVRPVRGAGNDLVQVAHHLAAVAHAQREGIGAREERCELVAGARVEQDRLGPAFARTQHVAVGKPAARDDALESGQRAAARDDVAHVHVVGVEAGTVERCRHLDMPVDALLAQDRDRADARRVAMNGAAMSSRRVEREARIETRLGCIEDAIELLVRGVGIVTHPLQRMRRRRPRAMQIDSQFVDHGDAGARDDDAPGARRRAHASRRAARPWRRPR